MNGKVLRSAHQEEYYFDERCFILESSNSDYDNDLSIARARVEPGVTTKWHRLKTSMERYYILSGTGFVEVGDQLAREVSCGDVVLIPPMSRQRIKNTGEEDLVFLAICSPRFCSEDYEDCEDREDCD